MIQTFGDQGTEDIFDAANTKQARKTLPAELHPVARRKLDWLNRARGLDVLKVPPSNHLEALHGNWKGYWSIRINDHYRIIFQWEDRDAFNVKIVDYH